MTDREHERRVLYEWQFANYSCRIVETEPGIVASEQAMDDDRNGRLWLSNRSPMGWPNEMLQLASALNSKDAEIERLMGILNDEQKRFGYFETGKLQEVWAKLADRDVEIERLKRELREAREAISVAHDYVEGDALENQRLYWEGHPAVQAALEEKP